MKYSNSLVKARLMELVESAMMPTSSGNGAVQPVPQWQIIVGDAQRAQGHFCQSRRKELRLGVLGYKNIKNCRKKCK